MSDVHARYFVSRGSLVGDVRAHGSTSSEQPRGKPLYPIDTMRWSASTMQAPTCVLGSLLRKLAN